MKKALTFTFADPNSPAVLEDTLRKILLDKLLAEFPCPDCSQTQD